MARLYGEAYLYISVKGDEGRQQEPLNVERVRRNGINLVQVLTDAEVIEGDIDVDPLSPGYGSPSYYEIAGASTIVRVHPTRMVVFRGAEKPQDWVFGRESDSVLTAALPAIIRHDSIVANVASLVYESRVDVITVPGLANLLQDPETESQLLRRFSLMSQMKGNNGLVLLNGTDTPGDPTETWEQKNATFTTLPDIITKAQEEVSAAARIPRAVLFGTGAGGLGATGDLELSAYYDYIETIQSNDIEPAMYVLDECIIRDALGARPEEIHYRWASLWQQSDKERAELADKFASAFEKIARSEIIPAQVMTKSVVNAFTESGILPGLEQDYKKWSEGGEDDMDGDDFDGEGVGDIVDLKDWVRPKTPDEIALEIMREYLDAK
jgi:phage-related protein (TIGR01555 family)